MWPQSNGHSPAVKTQCRFGWSSELHKGCQLLEMTEEPAPSRVTFMLYSRYNYRAEGDGVVFGDHILLYNSKYNQFLNCSEEICLDQ